MSNARITYAAFAVLALSALALGNGVLRYGRAYAGLQAVETRLVTTVGKAREVLDLSSRHQRVAAGERPPQDVIAQINRTLAEVGIRSDRLTGLQPVADSALGGGGIASAASGQYRRQSVSATIDRVQPAEIGRFLAEWRRTQPMWVPTRIELFHVRQQQPGGNLYSMRLEMTAIYLSDSTSRTTK